MLLNLPPEILIAVFREYFKLGPTEYISRTSVSLICKSIRATIEPMSYETILWKPNGRQFNPRMLLRTFLKRPELGALVRHVEIAVGPQPRARDLGSRTPFGLSMDELSTVMARAVSIYGNAISYWYTQFTERRVEAYAVMILSYTHRLQALKIIGGLQSFLQLGSSEYAPALALAIENAIFRLPTLTKVDFDESYTEAYGVRRYAAPRDLWRIRWESAEVKLLFGLPNISSARIHTMEPSFTSLDWSNIQPSNLRILHLVICRMDPTPVGDLLGAVPNLESLRLDFILDPSQSTDRALKWFDGNKIALAISKLKTCTCPSSETATNHKLKSLVINPMAVHPHRPLPGGPWEDENGKHGWGIKGHLGSFKDFKSLEYLEVDRLCLFGWSIKDSLPLTEIIPTSLRTLKLTQTLHIICEDNHYVWWLHGLQEYFKTRSNLKECRVDKISISVWKYYESGGRYNYIDSLSTFFKQCGTTLQVVSHTDIQHPHPRTNYLEESPQRFIPVDVIF